MNSRIKILRGTNTRIVNSADKLVKGQPLYNTDKNYLTISSVDNTSLKRLPITVREMKGWYSDANQISELTNQNNSSDSRNYYYIGGTSNNELLIKAPVINNAGSIKFRVDSNDIVTSGTTNTIMTITNNSVDIIGGGRLKSISYSVNNPNDSKVTAFSGDNTPAFIVPHQNNEINFGSNGSNIYFGYRTLNSTISEYYFGNGTGTSGQDSGNIHCGTLRANTSNTTNIISNSINGNTLTLTDDATLKTLYASNIQTPRLYSSAGLSINMIRTQPVDISKNGSSSDGVLKVIGTDTAGNGQVIVNGVLKVHTIDIITT